MDARVARPQDAEERPAVECSAFGCGMNHGGDGGCFLPEVMRYRTLHRYRRSFGNRPYHGALRSNNVKKRREIPGVFIASHQIFIVPVSNQRWCHDNASGNRCGVCLP